MNTALTSLLLAPVLAAAAFAQQATPPPAPLPDSPDAQVKAPLLPTGPTAVFDTTMGRMTCKLYAQEAPETVANFIGLATGTKDWIDPKTHRKVHGRSLYNGTTFHRVIPNFMIQGGDPIGTGEGDPGYMFADEFNPDLNFDVPGRLAMANSGPGTNGSQFFITEVPTPHLNQKHTIFGQCDDASLLIEQSIARVETGEQDKPVTPVILTRVTIVPEGQPLPAAPTSGVAPVAPKQ
jgi:peptidyl-prolyl cis-trans isomerase A (cyclophilin A)